MAFGALKAGAIFHPIDPFMDDEPLSNILADAEPALILTMAQHASRMLAACQARVPVVTVDASRGRPSSVASGSTTAIELDPVLARSADTRPPTRPGPEDPALLAYTAGTTGPPKGVLLTHRSIGAEGAHFVEMLRIHSDDTILAATPLTRASGWHAVVTALHAAATVTFGANLRSSALWRLASENGATILQADEAVLGQLATRASSTPPGHRIRVIVARQAAAMGSDLAGRLGVDHVADYYASTEAGVVAISPAGQGARSGAAGLPVPGTQLRILDPQGRDAPAGAIGEIAVHCPQRSWTYLHASERTYAGVDTGWFHTGDLGWIDEGGWLHFADRQADVLHVTGGAVSSTAIERTLATHPCVAEVAVIQRSIPGAGDQITAIVVPKGPLDKNGLVAFAVERLEPAHVPQLWEFRTSLPRTATHSVEKYKLRSQGLSQRAHASR
jgi:acyl-CoA synthetase (AMP-forming)/AMP-acid ligase II